MPADNAAILHITSAAGGGVDRYIRDLAARSKRRHLIWHVGQKIDVIEDFAARKFSALAEGAHKGGWETGLASWMRAAEVGLVHLHSLNAACRQRLAIAKGTLPYLVTLHDLLFINPAAFESIGVPAVDTDWVAQLTDTLAEAKTVIAPSAFIRDIAHRAFPPIDIAIVEPGIATAQPGAQPAGSQAAIDFSSRAPRHIVAVAGAIGPHKGSELLTALAGRLEGSDVGLVVIGYVDTKLTRGWVVPGHYYVHGAYRDPELPGLIAAYGAEAVLFPNRLPEAFSYTLSEVWASGLPVIVPDEGALGERVGKLGGGWRLPAGYDADAAATLLLRLFAAEGSQDRSRVQLELSVPDPRRAPPLTAMADSVNALYDRFALAPAGEARDASLEQEALAPLLAANLDGFAFREELVNLTNQIAQTSTWTAKLESDIAALSAELARTIEENRRLADDKAAFELLPDIVRRILIRSAFRARR